MTGFNRLRRGTRTLAWLLLALLAATSSTSRAGTMVDTTGYTDRDRQVYGPAVRYIVNDTARGIHVVWKDGLGDVRYNFRPRGQSWRWANGTVANLFPRNLGSMDVDLTTGEVHIGTDFVSRGAPRATYLVDTARTRGRFAEVYIGTGFRNILVGTSRYGWEKFAGVRNDSVSFLSTFSHFRLGRTGSFPGHNVAVSKQSGRYGFIWTTSDDPGRGDLYLKESPNNGSAWYATVNLSDSAPGTLTRSLLGGAAVYDSIRLHLVTGFHDGRDRNRSQLWHYAKYDSPPWYRVHEFALPPGVDVGDDALAAGRPSIGHNPADDGLFVAWEQFDADNVDESTGLARADIWASRSTDHGRTWGAPLRLTGPDEYSRRFPFLAEVVDDTLRLICFADRVAGFWEQGQGPQTLNPVLYITVPAQDLPVGIAEPPGRPAVPRALDVVPSVSRSGFRVCARPGTRLALCDNSGRVVSAAEVRAPCTRFDAGLAPGVYFVRARFPGQDGTAVARLTILP